MIRRGLQVVALALACAVMYGVGAGAAAAAVTSTGNGGLDYCAVQATASNASLRTSGSTGDSVGICEYSVDVGAWFAWSTIYSGDGSTFSTDAAVVAFAALYIDSSCSLSVVGSVPGVGGGTIWTVATTTATGMHDTSDGTCISTADVAAVYPVDGGGGGTGSSADVLDRLDLMWWGVWAVAGLLLVLIISPLWVRAWRFWQ